MLTLDPEVGEHWLAESEDDLGPGAAVLYREPFKPGVTRLHVRVPWREFRLMYLSESTC
jgi:hypothetical protein